MKPTSNFKESGPVLVRTNLTIGDCVATPTGRIGRIIPPNREMPLHHLVMFDDDHTVWMLKEILSPAPIKPATATRKRRKSA